MSFSQRHGFRPAKNLIQMESMDDYLKNGLWNGLTIYYWELTGGNRLFENVEPVLNRLARSIWINYFKSPIDRIGERWPPVLETIRNHFYSCEWYEVYDMLEFVAVFEKGQRSDQFQTYCNTILEKEVSGYRFLEGIISPITTSVEIDEIDAAIAGTSALDPVSGHLRTALEMISDRNSPDYRNSIKESISAVEALSQSISSEPSATLAQALKKIEASGVIKIHPALKSAFEKIYGYSSDADGIRHALQHESSLDSEDAIFMLVACSAFVNYMRAKSAKAGIATK